MEVAKTDDKNKYSYSQNCEKGKEICAGFAVISHRTVATVYDKYLFKVKRALNLHMYIWGKT